MESGELFCYNHPNRSTALRCNRCGQPICPQCAVLTPVGYRCKTCVRQQQKIFENARWYDYPVAFCVTGLVAGIGNVLSMFLGWFGILIAVLAGLAAERAANWSVRYRRGRYLWLAIIAGALAAGVLLAGLPLIAFALLLTSGQSGAWLAGLASVAPVVVFSIITVVVLAGRLRGRW